MGSPILLGPPPCQQEVSITQSFNCIWIYLSQLSALVMLPFLIILPSRSLSLGTTVGTRRKNTVNRGKYKLVNNIKILHQNVQFVKG